MAIDSIAPGTRVTVKIVKHPTNAAAEKTLARLLSKDAAAAAEDRRQSKVRKAGFRTKQRGGRQWEMRLPRQPIVKVTAGSAGTITANLDALRDLRSVERFVEVTPA
jgi:hypothetical protein